MEIKQIEIRDRATFIPALAIKFSGDDGYLFRRAGFGRLPYIILIRLEDFRAEYDCFKWLVIQGRSMHVAHKYLDEHWDEVMPESVIDVEYILAESSIKKESERL